LEVYLSFTLVVSPCYVAPFHHGMAHPWVVDGGNGLKRGG